MQALLLTVITFVALYCLAESQEASGATRQKRQANLFSCPGLNVRLFQDPNDCSFYYTCSNNFATRLQCPAGTYFNPQFNNCGKYNNINGCVMPQNDAATTRGQYRCPALNGLFRDTTDCTNYYRCTNGQPQIFDCPNNQVFYPDTHTCRFLDRAENHPKGCHMPSGWSPTGNGVRPMNCPGAQTVYLQDTADCASFFECSNNNAVRKTCSNNMVFEPSTTRCVSFRLIANCKMPASPVNTGLYKCPQAEGNFVDTSDCSQYYECHTGQAKLRECPAQQLFDAALQQCSVNAQTPGCHIPDGWGQQFQCPEQNGIFQDPFDCTFYYSCRNNAPTKMACQQNQLFDPVATACRVMTVKPNNCRAPAWWSGTSSTSAFNCNFRSGSFQDPVDCGFYYVCANNRAVRTQCPQNQLFDKTTGGCRIQTIQPEGCTVPSWWRTTSAVTFTCPRSAGAFQDVNDCSFYWFCSNNQPTRYPCPQGQMFNPTLGNCGVVTVKPSGCTPPAWFKGAGSTQFTCPQASGIFQNPSDCSKYYFCSQSRAQQFSCQTNQLLDPASKLCRVMTIKPDGCTPPSWWKGSSKSAFQCKIQSGVVQDETDCSFYYVCNNFQFTRFQCPQNQIYDPSDNTCKVTTIKPNKCIAPSWWKGTATATRFQCQFANGNFQDKTDCGFYYKCENSQPTRFQCPTRQLFDPNTGACRVLTIKPNECTAPSWWRGSSTSTFKCEVAKGDFQNPADCSLYYSCINFRPTRQQCGQNQLFDPQSKQCRVMAAAPSDCIAPSWFRPTPTFTAPFQCPSVSGYFPDPEDCSKYYVCSNSRSTRYQCQSNTVYDPQRIRCTVQTALPSGCKAPVWWTGPRPLSPGQGGQGTTTQFQCPFASGSYQDTTDCGFYYVCTNSAATRLPCGQGQLFDTTNRRCAALTSKPAGCVAPAWWRAATPDVFQCERPSGVFQDEADCSSYYICANSRPTKYRCPQGMLYNPLTIQCLTMTVKPADCAAPSWWQGAAGTSGTLPRAFQCPTAAGTFQDVTDCSYYYTCANSQPTRNKCPQGQLFNFAARQCQTMSVKPSGCTAPAWWQGTSTPQARFTCQLPNGLFQDANDCSRYYVCTNGRDQLFQCSQSQMFDSANGRCRVMTAAPSGCTPPTWWRPAANTGAAFNCPFPNGEYQRREDCTTFWRCDNSKPTIGRCQNNMVFNPQRGWCDWRSQPQFITGCIMPPQ